MPYLAFVLDDDSRKTLLERIPAKYSRVIAHHVTIVPPDGYVSADDLQRKLVQFKHVQGVSVRRLHEIRGVQAAGVRLLDTATREDGSYYHCTISVEPPHSPVESNAAMNSFVSILPFPIYGSVEILP